jgi:hypothetical protein
MPLPKQVQQALEAADAQLLAMNGEPPAQQATAQPVATAPAEPVQQPTQQPQFVEQQPRTEPTPQQVENWEQKYKTLQGIHNRHVGDLKARIDQLEAHIHAMQAAPAQTVTPVAEVNPQDEEAFGSDLVGMVRRTAETMYGGTASQFEGRLAQLERALQGQAQVVAKTADEVFIEGVRKEIPDFDTVNTSPEFLAWLAEEDDVYGMPRQTALTQAGNTRDLARVVKVFRAFLGTGAAAPKTPKSRLESQVTPRTSGNGAAAVVDPQAGKQYVSVAEVEGFYNDVRRGVYRGREQEMAKAEAVINAALAEGRIVQRVPRQSV